MWLKYPTITALIYFANCQKGIHTQRPAEKACDEIINNYEPSLGNYIVNGKKAVLGEFPHMVALAVELTNGTIFHCGGSLISPTYVLTAAHCVDAKIPDVPIIVRTGSLDVGNTEFNPDTDMRIVEKTIHPQYDRTLKYDDVALLRLPSPIETTANVSPICLETNEADPEGPLTVTGWGKIKSKGSRSEALLKASVVAVPLSNCAKVYRSNKLSLPRGIVNDHLCAGDPQGTRQDACQGDSGGPLIIAAKDGRSRLVGVTSFGRGCGTKIPGVYARVSSYIDWIEGIVWPN